LEEYTQRFGHDCKRFAKNEELSYNRKSVVGMARNFNLGADEDDTDELLEAVTQEFTNEELWELEQECTDEEEARKRQLKKKKLHSKGFSRILCRPQQAS
jgi:hypothetical protein